ncbi:MAG TPA: ABC transporter substrate-binding protein, partial [Ktedonobacteraceae bacterium]
MLTILRVRGASRRDIDGLSEANRFAYVFWLTSIPREVTAGVNLSRRYSTMRSRVISSHFCLPLLLFLFVLLTACGGSNQSSTPTPSQTPTVTLDAYGTPIVFPATAPQRIVSLVPNISEILGFLGLGGQVVGVDYYTNYPTNLTSLPKVSDVNGKYNIERIVALKPDLVLSYGEDTKQYDAQLQQVGLHVVDLPSGNLSLILQEILTVGRLTFAENAANNIVGQLQ